MFMGATMRGDDVRTDGLFSYVSCEERVPADHPLRPIRAIVDEALEVLSPEFAKLYSPIGRPSTWVTGVRPATVPVQKASSAP